MNKPTQDKDDILRIKDKNKKDVRLLIENTNLVIKFN